jgi:uncharacterized repeat protein (TIGR04138 family)
VDLEYLEIRGVINSMARRRGEYPPEAYLFTIDALNRIADNLSVKRHLSGPELLRGIVWLAHERFGRMALNVFDQWGISRTKDFGVIVYDLIDEGLLSKTEDDDLQDFEEVFDLSEALEEEAWKQKWRVESPDNLNFMRGEP